jgi:excisionase family DNA binding protein
MSELLKPATAASRLNVSMPTIRRMMKDGRLPVLRFGGRVVRIDEDDLLRFIQARREAA